MADENQVPTSPPMAPRPARKRSRTNCEQETACKKALFPACKKALFPACKKALFPLSLNKEAQAQEGTFEHPSSSDGFVAAIRKSYCADCFNQKIVLIGKLRQASKRSKNVIGLTKCPGAPRKPDIRQPSDCSSSEGDSPYKGIRLI